MENVQETMAVTQSTAMASSGAATVAKPVTTSKLDVFDKKYVKGLQEKYKAKAGKHYMVTTTISQDDNEERTYCCLFNDPKPASYDRYAKTSSNAPTRALKTFVLDNICEEQLDELEEVLELLPAMSISLGEKLLNILGLSKDTTVKKL